MQGPIQNLNEHLASPFVNNGFANATKCVPPPLCLPFVSSVQDPTNCHHKKVDTTLLIVVHWVLCAAS